MVRILVMDCNDKLFFDKLYAKLLVEWKRMLIILVMDCYVNFSLMNLNVSLNITIQ